MDFFDPKHRLDFYQNSKRGNILRALTMNDITYWGSNSFIAVIFALFVIEFVDGGSATHVGLALMIYSGISAGMSIPVGRFFDLHKGYLDEIWGLSLASFVGGAIYIMLSFSTELWHLYVAMTIFGLVSAVNLTSWRIVFYNNIDKDEYGETVGIYQTIFSIGEGAALALGGFMGERFGFDVVVFWGGVVMILGGFLPLMLREYFTLKRRKRSNQ